MSDLLLKCGNERNWWPRRVTVRGGQLHVATAHGEDGPSSLKLPLRHLSLQAGPLPNSLSLCRGQNIVLTLQTASQRAFDEWVKTIAIELIRQTPLDAIKYLDILTIADCWKRREESYEKDWNFNNCVSVDAKPETNCGTCKNHCEKININKTTVTANDNSTTISKIPERTAKTVAIVEEQHVEDLLKKCQNVENYVPVKEKLFLFESLCKYGRKVRSTEDVSLKVDTGTKRARSLHDLTNLNSHIAVREICKYFEKKNCSQDENNVVNCKTRPDLQFNDLYKCRKVLTT
ncbi:uncharacterized protein LOC108914954 [Anoplophora glabripennis]|uniref:uncharacterized protein LOC108914954 n=1 Tax=Anoplophora glabripennis TaxID=217634 RepID=UPI0008744708|nr:uncharacterized protein LOC108914954 [Anoplophora glabripennis]